MGIVRKERAKITRNGEYILAGDIGGTNCSLGIFQIRGKKPVILSSYHFKSRELKDLYEPISAALSSFEKENKIKIKRCCLGIAGAVSFDRSYVRLTNANLDLSTGELMRKTKLKKVALINDFEAAGYGISMLSSKDTRLVKGGHKIAKAPVVVLGAGTGLGKATMAYDSSKNMYVALPSEIHHADFPAQDGSELELVEFIKRYRKITRVTNGDVLSGEGLESIYLFLRKSGKFKPTRFAGEVDKSKDKPQLISRFRKKDVVCRKAFEMFANAYARFARGCALDALSYGGVYIAGGIGRKNQDIFGKRFAEEFEKSGKMNHVLRKIPIYLILGHDTGLLGAAFAGAKFLK